MHRRRHGRGRTVRSDRVSRRKRERERDRPEAHPYRSAPEPPKQRSFALAFVAAVAVMLGNGLMCSLVAMVSPIVALFAGVVGAMGGLYYGYNRALQPVLGPISGITLLIATAAVGVTTSMSGVAEALLYLPASDIAVRQAPEHRGATVFTLRAPVHHTELTGVSASRGRRGGPGTRYRAYAVTDRDWAPDEPIAAWACCVGAECTDGGYGSSDESRVALRVGGFYVDECRRAALRACERRRCNSRGDAVMLSFGPSWSALLAERARVPLLVAFIFGMAWVVALIYERVKGLKMPEPPPR